MKIIFQSILLSMISIFALGQEFRMKVTFETAPEKEVYLAHYYLGNIYADDTLKLDLNGTGIFRRDTLLQQGLYKIFLDENHHFDILLGADQEFELVNKTFSKSNYEVEGAPETEEFIRYMDFLSRLKKENAEIKKRLITANEEEKTDLQNQLSSLNSKLIDYWKEIENKYPDTFLARFLMANYVAELDESTLPPEILQNDSLLLLEKFRYQHQHFWDHFDYTDERFLYTPLLKPKLETWFTRVLYQNYDSVKPYVFRFIEDTRPHKRIFQFVTSWFLNSSINSNVIGMDALFIDLARAYYLSGEAYWASEESIEKIKENVLFLEHNLIGQIAPDLTLESVDGEYYNLHQVESKRTCVLIYEPNCSHCKEFVPKFYNQVYKKYKDKGLEVYAIYSMENKEEWTEFLAKYQLWDWINVWDKDHVSQFKILYDGRKTPGIFVLDENKKIISKKLSVDQLEKLMQYQLN